MEIIIVSTVKIFLREISHKFFGKKGLILSISFYLIVPILMQIIIRHAGWGSLGIHKEGNLIAMFWGLFVGILWAGVLMSIVGYLYGFTHNILTAWMCWFISRVCILFFARIGKNSFA